MEKIFAGILGMGHYLPDKVLTNYDLEKMVDTNNDWIVEGPRKIERHSVISQNHYEKK